MKKVHARRTCSLLLGVFLFTMPSISAFALENESVNKNQFLKNQYYANVAFNKLLDEFDMYGVSGKTRIPDYYAGAYIGDDGHLVVLIKNANVDDIQNLKEICDERTVRFETADFSYNELMQYRDAAREVRDSGTNTDYQIETLSIRDGENKVYVGVKSLTTAAPEVNALQYGIKSSIAVKYSKKSLANSQLENIPIVIYQIDDENLEEEEIVINKGEDITPEYPETSRAAAIIRPGTCVKHPTKAEGSVGFSGYAMIDGEQRFGFFTAAHYTWTLLNMEDRDGNRVGKVIKRQHGGKYDVAFVETTGFNVSRVNKFLDESDGIYKTIMPNRYMTPAVGTLVKRIGAVSVCYEGHVTSIHFEVKDGSGPDLTGMISGSFTGKPGDSGGLVYMDVYSGNNPTGEVKVVGLFCGQYGEYYAMRGAALASDTWMAWPENP